MKWRIEGADRNTGRECLRVVDAHDETEAVKRCPDLYVSGVSRKEEPKPHVSLPPPPKQQALPALDLRPTSGGWSPLLHGCRSPRYRGSMDVKRFPNGYDCLLWRKGVFGGRPRSQHWPIE
jgi:hypothetical protein